MSATVHLLHNAEDCPEEFGCHDVTCPWGFKAVASVRPTRGLAYIYGGVRSVHCHYEVLDEIVLHPREDEA